MNQIDLTPEWTDERYRVSLRINSTGNGLTLIRHTKDGNGETWVPFPGNDPAADIEAMIERLKALRDALPARRDVGRSTAAMVQDVAR